MSKKNYSLPQSTFVCEIHHKYAVNDKVRNINKEHKMYGEYGIIKSLVPYSFKHPAYDVTFGDKIVAISEKSLRKENPVWSILSYLRSLFLQCRGNMQ